MHLKHYLYVTALKVRLASHVPSSERYVPLQELQGVVF